jgi:hypothetical protein
LAEWLPFWGRQRTQIWVYSYKVRGHTFLNKEEGLWSEGMSPSDAKAMGHTFLNMKAGLWSEGMSPFDAKAVGHTR